MHWMYCRVVLYDYVTNISNGIILLRLRRYIWLVNNDTWPMTYIVRTDCMRPIILISTQTQLNGGRIDPCSSEWASECDYINLNVNLSINNKFRCTESTCSAPSGQQVYSSQVDNTIIDLYSSIDRLIDTTYRRLFNGSLTASSLLDTRYSYIRLVLLID